MTKAIRIHENGGPEVLRFEDYEVLPPGPGEARVRQTAIGINFSDINVRRGGFYTARPAQFPLILGNEAAGVVTSVGPGVTGVTPGDRVAYAGMTAEFFERTGAYAEERNVPAERLLKLPATLSDQQAAGMMAKGFTASLIINHVYRPKVGDTILIHAAASGVGLVLTQWAKYLGASVIGTVGSSEKARIAKAHGCDHTVLYREVDFVDAVKDIAPPGVAAVFDGVGKDTFVSSLRCVRPFGMLVNYGNASGRVPPIDLLKLSEGGSLSVCRPALSTLTGNVALMRAAAAELFDLVGRGVFRIRISGTYALRDAAAAHRDIEARAHAGSVLLLP
ncbi:quinone oxidoreductase [Candidatus Kaiserbacteria bacterium]|nr:quinone oxidoreductase [Candidatus Kaiserbacteria bacterium]